MDRKEFDFLITLYNGLSKEIEFTKKQQWMVTNGTLIIYGIIITFHFRYFKSIPTIPIAKSLCVGVWIVGQIYLYGCRASLKNNSVRMKEVLSKFPINQKIEDKIKPKLLENLSDKIPYLYYGVIFFGLSVVWWIITKVPLMPCP